MGRLQRLLNVGLQAASDAVKYFLRLVKGHIGEIAVSFVKSLLERFGVKCGHNGKANKFLDLLRRWDWIRVTASEKWYARETERKGRARTYAIGEAMAWCEVHGIPPSFKLAEGAFAPADLPEALKRGGFMPSTETLVMTAPIAPA